MADQPYAKKHLGQHWLSDQSSLESICEAGELNSKDTVLEIGPGFGNLTKLLVARAKQVVAVEFDSKLAALLPARITNHNLSVVSQDILSFNFNELPADYKIIANIPYYLTSNLIRTLSEAINRPQLAVLLVQKEVAQRLAAGPGAMSILSITAQFYWQVSLGETVPAYLFSPAPKVDSQVIILKRLNVPLFFDVNPKVYFRIVKAGFSQRRKTLLNALSSGLKLSKDDTVDLILKSNLKPNIRSQNLSLEDWYQIYKQALNYMELLGTELLDS